MDVRLNLLLVQKVLQDVRVGSGNLLVVEPLQPVVFGLLMDGQRETAFAESQPVNDFSFFGTFHELVFPHDAQVGHAVGHTLRNIVVAQEEHLHGEVGRLCQQGTFGSRQLDVGFCEQGHCVFKQTPFGLYGNS